MNKETKETAAAMAEYSRSETKKGKQKVTGILLSAFGIFVIVSALMMFPNESSWGSIYSILGSIFLIAGIYLIERQSAVRRSVRIVSIVLCVLLLFGTFTVSDYIAVKSFHQVPRFRYETIYDSGSPDQIVHKTLFFTVIQKNPGKENEEIFIAD